MDPSKVATPVRSVVRPNTDGSIGGDKGYALALCRPDREYFHHDRQLLRRVIYPHAKRDAKGKCSPITEQEEIAREACQDRERTGDKY